MTTSIWEWKYVWEALPELLRAFLEVTLVVTLAGSAIAAVLGLVIAILRRTAPKPFRVVLTFFVNFVRMTPIVVQLLFAYYALTSVSPMTIGIIIFGVHYAT